MLLLTPLLPPFGGDDYDIWTIKIRALLEPQGLWELVETGASNTPEDQKRDVQALFIIRQSVADKVFTKIAAATSAKEAWTILKTAYQGNSKVHSELQSAILYSCIENYELRLKKHESESLSLKEEIKTLTARVISVKEKTLSQEKKLQILKQEKEHLQEKYLSECKRFEEKKNVAGRNSKQAVESVYDPRAEVVMTQKEKVAAQRLGMECSAFIERTQCQPDILEIEESKWADEMDNAKQSDADALFKVYLLEKRAEEHEKKIKEMLDKNNQQKSSTVQVLEGLLAKEQEAHAKTSIKAKVLSLQLQATQQELDMLKQDMAKARLNESALDRRLKGKKSESKSVGTSLVHDVDYMEAEMRNCFIGN